MTDRRPHFQIVRTDAGWHARLLGGNGEPITSTEVHPDSRDAASTVAVIAEAFGITMTRPPEEHDGHFWGYDGGGDLSATRVEYVDERGTDTDADAVVDFAEQPSVDAMRRLRHVHIAGRCVKRSAGPHCEETR